MNEIRKDSNFHHSHDIFFTLAGANIRFEVLNQGDLAVLRLDYNSIGLRSSDLRNRVRL